MARLKSELLLSLADNVSRPAKGVDSALDRLERRQGGFAGAMTRGSSATAKAASMLGIYAAAAAPLAAGLVAKESITAAADFESALTNIQKKAGTTAEQTRQLGEEIKALATSGLLASPIEDITAAYERGSAAGIPLGELREFALLSAKAADAFDMSATDVGNASAGFKTVLKIPMNEMERYFDLINGLADSGIADESGIVDFIDRAGSMGKTFGMTAEQTAALGASLANMKVPAEQASTAVNSIFANLLAPQSMSKAGQAAFKQLVGSNKKFAAAVKNDANGAFIGLLDTLKELDESTRTGLIVDIFGKENMKTMLAMVEGSAEIKRNSAYVAGTSWFGSLDKSYKLKLDDVWSQWQQLKTDMSVLMIDIGTSGMPALKGGLEGAKYLVEQIGEGFEAFKAKIDTTEIGVAGEAIANLSAAITTLMGVDTSQSAIPQFFREIADAANDVASAVNKVDQFFRKPFENWGNETITPEKREAIKKQQPVEQYDPGSGQSYREWLQAKRARDLAGGTASVPGTMSPDSANIPAVNAGSTPSRIASEKSLAERASRRGIQGPNLPRDGGFGGYGPQVPATPTPRPSPQVKALATIGLSPPPAASVTVLAPAPPVAAPAPVPMVSPREAESASIAAMVRQFAAIMDRAGSFQPGTTGTDVRDEAGVTVDTAAIDAARATATEAGVAMTTALSITGRPVVDVSGISAARREAEALAATLRSIPGLAQTAARSSYTSSASEGVLNADVER